MSLDRPGFANPVLDAQASFRAVLAAMAQPGSVVALGADVLPPDGLTQAAAAVLLSLADAESPLWLSPDLTQDRPGIAEWLAFHCGTSATSNPMQAAFAVADGVPALADFAAGTEMAPEQSATLIAQVRGLGQGMLLTITGPGVRGERRIAVDGLPDDFAARWACNHARYPRGVDLLLCCGATLLALPRSLTVKGA